MLEAHPDGPTTPFIKALSYARERRMGLEVFLSDPDVPPDTNHLERALRTIPMGRNYGRQENMETFHQARPKGRQRGCHDACFQGEAITNIRAGDDPCLVAPSIIIAPAGTPVRGLWADSEPVCSSESADFSKPAPSSRGLPPRTCV